MMKKSDEFYIGYSDNLSSGIRKVIIAFIVIGMLLLIFAAVVFSLNQNKFSNGSFELSNDSKLIGVYHETPYPMLQVKLGPKTFKNILLLGFGKSGANPFLDKIKEETKVLNQKTLMIEGNLIYYNGKTLLQITDEEKITLMDSPEKGNRMTIEKLGTRVLFGEIIDPKCYFGVMKPGYGKIHRSCAVRCISGGIPPVFVSIDEENIPRYYLITDAVGQPIKDAILPYIGKPSELKGKVEKLQDWMILRLEIENIKILNDKSKVY